MTAPPRVELVPLVELHRDDALLVVDKPSGLVVHRGASVERDSVVERLARFCPEARPCHRLDRGTSGALVTALAAEAAREVSAWFSEGRVGKRYLALVRGAVGPEPVLVDHPVPVDEDGPRVEARTWIRGLATVELGDSPLREVRYSWIEALPLTGRFHQIRRHCKHLGHPIAGDSNYGRSEHNRHLRARFGLSRLALHAASIALPPMGARTRSLSVEAPLPIDLAGPLSAMGFELRATETDAAARTSRPWLQDS